MLLFIFSKTIYDPRREGLSGFCTKNLSGKKIKPVKGGHFKNLEKKNNTQTTLFACVSLFFVIFLSFISEIKTSQKNTTFENDSECS